MSLRLVDKGVLCTCFAGACAALTGIGIAVLAPAAVPVGLGVLAGGGALEFGALMAAAATRLFD